MHTYSHGCTHVYPVDEADAEESSGGLSTGAIIGIVAAVLFVGATGAFFVLRMKRRKRFTTESTTDL